MTVENFWRQLKHDFLHHFFRPRVDLLVWILINNVTPAYVACAEVLEDTHRLGRPNKLTSFQTKFKSAWKKLAELPVSGRQYNIDLESFICDCGRQKYQAHHLCKHLVQAVTRPLEPRFWRQVIRRRTTPLYRHPHLLPAGASYHDPDDGRITDGDDHVWLGDKDILSGGRWRDIASDPVTGKRAREDDDETTTRSSSPLRTSSPITGHGGDSDDEEEVSVPGLLTFLICSLTDRDSHIARPHESNARSSCK